MTLGYEGTLFILAFDHRGSFQKKFFGIEGAPDPEEAERIIDAKRVIFEGMQRALAEGLDASTAGVLVDEQFGTQVAMDAKQAGMVLAMPAEKSGQDEFDFEYGSEFTAHIESFDPTFTKVLVRYNPEGDGAVNARQSVRLKELSDWLHHTGRRFLFELLVPAEPHQLEAVGNDGLRYDREVRPALDEGRDRRAAGERHRGRRLEDRGHRRPGDVRRDRRAVPHRRARRCRVRRARPRRRRRGGRRVAARGAAGPGVPGASRSADRSGGTR